MEIFEQQSSLKKSKLKKQQFSDEDRSGIANYLTSLKKYPQLSHEEMITLFKKYEQGGSIALKQRKS